MGVCREGRLGSFLCRAQPFQNLGGSGQCSTREYGEEHEQLSDAWLLIVSGNALICLLHQSPSRWQMENPKSWMQSNGEMVEQLPGLF